MLFVDNTFEQKKIIFPRTCLPVFSSKIERDNILAISKKLESHVEALKVQTMFRGSSFCIYFRISDDCISELGTEPPFRATSFSGMFKVVLSEPPFWDQPYLMEFHVFL